MNMNTVHVRTENRQHTLHRGFNPIFFLFFSIFSFERVVSFFVKIIVESIKSNQIKSNQIKSNQIKSNRIKSNQIESNRIKSNQIESNRIKSNQENENAHRENENVHRKVKKILETT
jgi:ribosomal protein L16/L10AE